MSALNELLKIGSFVGVTRTRKTKRRLADSVIRNLHDNLALLKNPNHMVTIRKRQVPPKPCFVKRGAFSLVWINFQNQKVDVTGNKKPQLQVDESQIEAALNGFIKMAEGGEIDAILERINADKKAKLLAKKAG